MEECGTFTYQRMSYLMGSMLLFWGRYKAAEDARETLELGILWHGNVWEGERERERERERLCGKAAKGNKTIKARFGKI